MKGSFVKLIPRKQIFDGKSLIKIDKKAFYLQIPYILWLLFAFYLNYQVFILNR